MDLKISDLQIAIFTPSLDFSNKLSIANSLQKGMPGIFDANPTMLPVPDDAPAEIPRIIFKNTDSSYMMNIGLNRFDFYYHDRKMTNRIPTKTFKEVQLEVIEKIDLTAKTVKEIIGAKVIRLGFIPTFVTKVKDAKLFIRDNFFNTSKIKGDVREINFSTNRKEKIGKFDINVGVNGSAFRKLDDELDNKVVIFNIDINTPGESNLDLKVIEINDFYEKVFVYVKDKKTELLV